MRSMMDRNDRKKKREKEERKREKRRVKRRGERKREKFTLFLRHSSALPICDDDSVLESPVQPGWRAAITIKMHILTFYTYPTIYICKAQFKQKKKKKKKKD